MAPQGSESMPPVENNALFPNEDEEYDSSEDSDFDIDAAPAEAAAGDASSDSEPDVDTAEGGGEVDGEASQRAKKRRKISFQAATDKDGGEEVVAELDSGDEATIRRAKDKAKRRKAKKSKKRAGRRGLDDDDDDEQDDDFDDDDDGGGEGGFVRTRGMRMKMQEDRKPLARADQSTVNVDELWARINAPTTNTRTSTGNNKTDEPATKDSDRENDVLMADEDKKARPGEETITIKRKYKFAGDIITEEKVVPRDSAEAKLYLSLNKSTTAAENETESSKKQQDEQRQAITNLRRPLRRISRFDPNPPGAIKQSWEKNVSTTTVGGDESPGAGEGSSGAPKGPKLNTVEKSKLDWAAYVDQEGIKDDLDVHSKAKEGYHSRMEFLNRIEDKREEERRNARLKNMG